MTVVRCSSPNTDVVWNWPVACMKRRLLTTERKKGAKHQDIRCELEWETAESYGKEVGCKGRRA
ncbi:unnamed protein product [Prunus armeniaca]|uniref:Uncharacterized protein n=1 Tax=Prunus armeniaca TaxID=36596 RepID=A0A6J5XP34_PRUAR|nr:unnamed protein product [Prunus armeniaca]